MFTELLIIIKECYFKFDIVHAVSHTIDQILILEYMSSKVIKIMIYFSFKYYRTKDHSEVNIGGV